MLSAIIAAAARKRFHYGWVVVAATFLTMLVTAAAVSAPGVLIVPLQHEFGWTTSQISSALAIRLLFFGVTGPFAAAFMNRFGIRPVVLVALTLIISALLGSLFMSRLWQLVMLWGVVVGLATGLTATVLGATVATRWFTHRRGLVIGLLSASSATGQLLFLPLMASLSEQYGWRAMLTFVCALLGVAAAAVFLLMRDRPADVGLPAYGESEIAPLPAMTTGLASLLLSPVHALREAARAPMFWVLFGTFFVCGASTNGLIQTHFITLCGDHGMRPVGAAGVLAVMGIFDFFGTVASGWLSDRFDNRKLLFWYYVLRGLSLVYLPFADFTMTGLSVFAVFYGLDWIATVPPTVKLVADRFGRERAPLVFGWIFTGHQLGAASAAYGAGFSRTAAGTYAPAFFVAGALCMIAAICMLASRARAQRSTLATV